MDPVSSGTARIEPSWRFTNAVEAARRDLGEDLFPAIRLHDVRHTHATLLLARGTPVKVVQERLGHASTVITLTIYAHILPGMQAAAAMLYGELMTRS